jgi:hypothetical protein
LFVALSMGGQAILQSIGEQYPAHGICCGVSWESKRSRLGVGAAVHPHLYWG